MRVHQVKGRLVNSYVIEDCNGLLVVDVAVRGEKYVLGYIEDILKRPHTDVELVIASHDDPDHIGGVRSFAKQCGASVALPYAANAVLRKVRNDPTGHLFRFTSLVFEGFRPRAWKMYFNPQRAKDARQKPYRNLEIFLSEDEKYSTPDYHLKNNDTLPIFSDWRVIHTPGHSWDSCCYYHEESGSLITGDTLLGSGKKGFLVRPSIFSNPLQMSYTIKKLRRLNPRFVYPGHGSCFTGEDLLHHLS